MGITYEPLDGDVAERIDNLFGHKNCLIEVNPGKVLMPPRYEEIGDRIRSLDVRPDDVWVVSYPRTGEHADGGRHGRAGAPKRKW